MSYVGETLSNLLHQTAFFNLTWGNYVMILVAFVFLFLAIKKGFEPLLLVPIAFGMLLVNIYPDIIASPEETSNGVGGLLYYFYSLDEWSILPSLIFMGVGAMTDFGPLIANPISFLLGAAAQFGIFGAYFMAILLGFNDKAAAGRIHHRRCGRSYLHFPCGKTGADRTDGTHCRGGLFLYGVSAHYSAAYYETVYHKAGARHQDAESAPCFQTGENSVSNRGYSSGMYYPSYHSTPGWYADVRKPVP